MNDPRTCVYGHARKFGVCGERGTCTRPRGLPCLCGLVKARVPEPGPDKLAVTFPKPALTVGWGTVTGRISSHEPPFHELPGSPALKRAAQRSLGLEDLDFVDLEHRVLALCTCEEAAAIKKEAWDALGRCPWDNWKPGRDV